MLSKNKIDKKLEEYVKRNRHSGYSRKAVKKVLVDHGYDEQYVESLLKKHTEKQFVKRYAIAASILFLISIFAFNPFPIGKQKQELTGYATVISASDEGCCMSVCQQTGKDECYGDFAVNKKCDELEECTVGCCIDKEGYCLQNYLSGEGANIYKDCGDIVFCKNITDKSYWARAYSITGKRGAGFASVKPNAGYYKSTFNIRYFLYDKKDVASVSAEIKDDKNSIAIIELYDDGAHNDAGKNDNLYAANWDSSELTSFDGYKSLHIDINVGFADGTKQTIGNAKSFVVINNNKCLPIYTDWSNPDQKHGIIFAAQKYDNLSDGWTEFENDANSFLGTLFSLTRFSANKDLINVYRLEESLTYSDISTVKNSADKDCPAYNETKDLIIILDKGEDYCVEEEDGIVRINPHLLFYKNSSDAELGQVLSDFCKYALTPKKIADDILDFIGPPKIIMETLDNLTYNTSKVNLTFNISSKNYPVADTVYLDGVKIYTSTLSRDSSEIVELTLINGSNEVMVGAEDKNENVAYAQLVLNATIE